MILGSNPFDALIRCACSHKFFALKELWRRRGFVACDGCGSLVGYHSLTVSRGQGSGRLVELIGRDEELIALRGLEDSVRGFVDYYDRKVGEWQARGGRDDRYHPFVEGTRRLVENSREIIKRLDELRERTASERAA